jgi:NitT/TauT family transport system substrate-binding protein
MKEFSMLRKFALLLLLLIVPGVSAQTATDLTLFMTFIPNVQFAPVYVALENGYFADAGINLTIQHGDEPDGLQLIGAGELQFGIIGGEQVILARANDLPVVFVYEWFQKFPVGVVAPSQNNITTAADLRGRKVGVPGRFGGSYTGLVALLAANGMTESDIQLEAIGFNAPEVVCIGGVEASVVYINNEPLQIQNRADAGECGDTTAVNVISISDAADMVSNGLVTNEATIAENPERVSAVVAGFDQGLKDSINNPAAAYLFSSLYVENLLTDADFETALKTESANQEEFLTTNPDREAIAASRAAMLERLSVQFDANMLVQFQVLLNSIELWDADQLGYSDLASWEVTAETLTTMEFLPEQIDLEAAFTNDFLPAE